MGLLCILSLQPPRIHIILHIFIYGVRVGDKKCKYHIRLKVTVYYIRTVIVWMDGLYSSE